MKELALYFVYLDDDDEDDDSPTEDPLTASEALTGRRRQTTNKESDPRDRVEKIIADRLEKECPQGISHSNILISL